MLTAVACDQSVQLKVAYVVAGISAYFSKFAFVFIKPFVLIYSDSLEGWSLREQRIRGAWKPSEAHFERFEFEPCSWSGSPTVSLSTQVYK